MTWSPAQLVKAAYMAGLGHDAGAIAVEVGKTRTAVYLAARRYGFPLKAGRKGMVRIVAWMPAASWRALERARGDMSAESATEKLLTMLLTEDHATIVEGLQA